MIRIEGGGLVRSLRQLEDEVGAAARRILAETADFAARTARKTDTFKDGSAANLRKSIVTVVKGPWHVAVQAGGPTAPYAAFVEDGTRAHVIEARRARALRFVVAGQLRFARHVSHPGTKPTHFMRVARDAVERALPEFGEAGLSGLFR